MYKLECKEYIDIIVREIEISEKISFEHKREYISQLYEESRKMERYSKKEPLDWFSRVRPIYEFFKSEERMIIKERAIKTEERAIKGATYSGSELKNE